MWSYRHVVESTASARAVWDCLTDVERWNEHAGIKMAKLHGALAVGAKITTKCVGLPSSTSTITVLDRRGCSLTKTAVLPSIVVSLSTALSLMKAARVLLRSPP